MRLIHSKDICINFSKTAIFITLSVEMFGVLFTCLASLDKMCAEKTRQDSLHKELLHLLPELRDGFFFYTTVKHASRVMWYSVVSRYTRV